MLEYVYIVKCPNCEDEHFYFFNDAKEFALSSMSRKPVITQVEVNRNDFGECTDSADLGTVWSWEDMMKTDSEPAISVFSQGDLGEYNPDDDSEFAALDNSLEAEPVAVESETDRKPVPADMTIEQLVEEMEENEDTVECKWCNELFDKSECRYEVDLGWLCDRCQAAILSRGEQLTFREGPLDEAMDARELVELEYPSLTATIYGEKRDVDDWDEFEHTDSFVYLVPKVDIVEFIWIDCITEEDVTDVEGGLETLEDDTARENFLETHFDALFEKYNKEILKYFEDEATEDFRERSQEEYEMSKWAQASDDDYDEWRDNEYFGESVSTANKSMLEELEEPNSYRKRLNMCPECGDNSFDAETGICISCGFN